MTISIANYNSNPFLEFNINYCTYLKNIFSDYDELFRFFSNCNNDKECEEEIRKFLDKIVTDYTNFDTLIKNYSKNNPRNDISFLSEVYSVLELHTLYYTNAKELDFSQFNNFINLFEATKEYVKRFAVMIDYFHSKIFPNKFFSIRD